MTDAEKLEARLNQLCQDILTGGIHVLEQAEYQARTVLGVLDELAAGRQLGLEQMCLLRCELTRQVGKISRQRLALEHMKATPTTSK